MDWMTVYRRLMYRAKRRTPQGYSESHHFKPRCMGGDNSPENLRRLTAREHFIAHMLLARIYPRVPGLHHAAFMLAHTLPGYRPNSHSYESAKRRHAEAMRIAKIGNKHGLGFKHSEETKKLQSLRMKGKQLCLGRVLSQETRDKISASNKGKCKSAAHVEANRQARFRLSATPGITHRADGWFVARHGAPRRYIGAFRSLEAANAALEQARNE